MTHEMVSCLVPRMRLRNLSIEPAGLGWARGSTGCVLLIASTHELLCGSVPRRSWDAAALCPGEEQSRAEVQGRGPGAVLTPRAVAFFSGARRERKS